MKSMNHQKRLKIIMTLIDFRTINCELTIVIITITKCIVDALNSKYSVHTSSNICSFGQTANFGK